MEAVFIGFAIMLGLLQIWHLFWPVDWRATVALLSPGTFFFLKMHQDAFETKGRKALILSGAVVAVWLAFRGMDFARNYDSGLYHFASVRWANEYAIVPGLANLHERLGFNQSFFLWVALLNAHPFWTEGYHIANSFLLFVLTAGSLSAFFEPPFQTGDRGTTVLAALLPPIFLQGLSSNISSPSPDLAVFVCGAVVLMALARIIANPQTEITGNHVVVIMVGLAGCTLKFSFAAFGLTAITIMLGQQLRSTRLWIITLAAAIALIGPFGLRGAILSGYPFFPILVFPLPVDWCVPHAAAIDTANSIYAWARTPGVPWTHVLGSWHWLGPWWERTRHMPQFYLPIMICGGFVAAGLFIRSWRRNLLGWSPLALPALVALVAWFFTAPDPRFGNWLLWLAEALATATLLVVTPAKHRRSILLAVFAITIFALSIRPWLRIGGFAPIPQASAKIFVTESGLQILIPAEVQNDQLWNTPLPASPYPRADLRLRGTNLSDGFRRE